MNMETISESAYHFVCTVEQFPVLRESRMGKNNHEHLLQFSIDGMTSSPHQATARHYAPTARPNAQPSNSIV